MKKIAIAIAIILVFAGAFAIGNYRRHNIEEYAKRNNCTWTYYYDEPICELNNERTTK